MGQLPALSLVAVALGPSPQGVCDLPPRRYVPSQADVAVFEAVSGPPPADLYHALRWYNHIKSYEKEKAR